MRKRLSCCSPPHGNELCSLIWIWNSRLLVIMTIPSFQCVIQLYRPVSSCPYRKDGLFADTNLQGPVPRESPRNPWKSFAQQQIESRLFFLFWRLTTTFSLSASLLRRLPDHIRHVFLTRISCQLFTFLNDGLVARARPFPFPWQRRWNIGYEYWERSALRNGMDLACETKPTVCRHKQKQMQHYSNKHKLVLQRSH